MTGRRGRVLAIVQARMSSTRFPGKVLKDLQGKPMITRQLERVARATSIDQIVVATSQQHEDDELARILETQGIDVVRGPLDDVLARFIAAIDRYQPDVVVRVTADCPLISPSVIDLVVESFHAGEADYVSNTMAPTFPDGLDVEVVTPRALQYVHESSVDPHEREHVTLGVYRRGDRFAIENVPNPSGADHSDLRWTVDTAEDFIFVESIYNSFFPGQPNFDYHDVLTLLEHRPALHRTSADSARNAALDGLDTGAMSHPGNVVER